MAPDFIFNLDFQTVLGYFAATLTTLSFLPQVIRVYRTKNTDAISFWMYLLFSAGVFFLVHLWRHDSSLASRGSQCDYTSAISFDSLDENQ